MTVSSYVVFDANGNAVNSILLSPDSIWQPPSGCTIQHDPDGLIWAAATIATPEPAEPLPDWTAFKRAAIASPAVNQALAAAMPSAPIATNAVTPALMAVAEGNPADDFRAVWLTLRRLDLIPQDTLNQLTSLAQQCNLPDDFVRVLGGQE